MKLFNVFLSFLFCFLPTVFLFTQTQIVQQQSQTVQNRDRLLKVLEQETTTSATDSDTQKFFTLVPERLPSWVNQIPTATENKVYVLGISDPGMDEETGYIVAKLRLKAVYSIISGSVVSNIRDFYAQEHYTDYSNVFIDFTSFENKINIDENNINIIESHVTKYDETILLGEIDINDLIANNPQSELIVTTGVMSNARRVGTRTEMVSKSDIDISYKSDEQEIDFLLYYETHAINRRINSETKLNESTISSLPALGLRYAVENQNEDEPYDGQISYSLRNGIWYAYITAVMFELADMAHGYAIHISNIHDIFDHITQNLTREVVSNHVSCQQKTIKIRANNLYINCGYPSSQDTYNTEQP